VRLKHGKVNGHGPYDVCGRHRVDEAIRACRTASVREALAGVTPLGRRATRLLWERNYYPTRFASRACVYRSAHARRERLSLPLSARDFDGVVFADEPGLVEG